MAPSTRAIINGKYLFLFMLIPFINYPLVNTHIHYLQGELEYDFIYQFDNEGSEVYMYNKKAFFSPQGL